MVTFHLKQVNEVSKSRGIGLPGPIKTVTQILNGMATLGIQSRAHDHAVPFVLYSPLARIQLGSELVRLF